MNLLASNSDSSRGYTAAVACLNGVLEQAPQPNGVPGFGAAVQLMFKMQSGHIKAVKPFTGKLPKCRKAPVACKAAKAPCPCCDALFWTTLLLTGGDDRAVPGYAESECAQAVLAAARSTGLW